MRKFETIYRCTMLDKEDEPDCLLPNSRSVLLDGNTYYDAAVEFVRRIQLNMIGRLRPERFMVLVEVIKPGPSEEIGYAVIDVAGHPHLFRELPAV